MQLAKIVIIALSFQPVISNQFYTIVRVDSRFKPLYSAYCIDDGQTCVMILIIELIVDCKSYKSEIRKFNFPYFN